MTKSALMKTAGRLAIAVTAAAIVLLGGEQLAGQCTAMSRYLVLAAKMPIPQRYAAYLTPLDRSTLNGVQGRLDKTNHVLDLTISGNGYFHIKTPDGLGDGSGFTRRGTFRCDSNGDLVVVAGEQYKLTPPINIPPGATNLSIAMDGTVQCTLRGQVQVCTCGQIQLSYFDHRRNLQPLGCGIFAQTDSSGPAIIATPGEQGVGTLMQGFLETDPAGESVASLK